MVTILTRKYPQKDPWNANLGLSHMSWKNEKFENWMQILEIVCVNECSEGQSPHISSLFSEKITKRHFGMHLYSVGQFLCESWQVYPFSDVRKWVHLSILLFLNSVGVNFMPSVHSLCENAVFLLKIFHIRELQSNLKTTTCVLKLNRRMKLLVFRMYHSEQSWFISG